MSTAPPISLPEAAAHATRVGLVYLDRQGVLVGVDAVAAVALGLSDAAAAQATGRRLDELVPRAAAWTPLVARVLDAPGAPLALPTEALVGEGWRGELRARPALPGAPALALAVLVDEGPRRQLARRLSRHELLARTTHEAMWDFDVATRELWWNDHMFALFGLAPGSVEPSFERWAGHIHPDDRARVLAGIDDLHGSDRASLSHTYHFVRVDGSVGTAVTHAVVDRDAAGRPRRIIGSVTDVSERVATERKLIESEALFRQLTETIRDVFWIGEPRARRVLYVSPAWDAIWGFPRQMLLDDPSVLLRSVHPEDRERVTRSMRTSHEETFDQTFRIVRPDGTIAWIHDRGYPIRDVDGAIVRVVGLATDITVERAFEERLAHASKLESIGRLAGGVAHDFNNMLTVILSGAESAMRKLPPAHRALPDLEDVHAGAERAAELTRQLLVFARQQAIAPSLVDLNQLVLRTEGMLRRLLGEPVELALELAEGAAQVWADRGQLEQVLVNLAVNGRDAMPAGGTLTIRTERVAVGAGGDASGWEGPAGEHVQLTVRDDGEGMPAEVLAHVFEPFFTTKGPGRGTGLGLATCYGIVKRAGGQIRVRSESGRGTTFEILLPASAEAAQAGEDTPRHDFEGGSETILFVEDQVRLRHVAVRLLAEAGYEVLSAADGQEALALAAARPGGIDLLVTDVIMPHMNGVELATRMREQSPGLRVLLSSGYPDDALPESGLPAGMTFLPKPYQGSTLLRTVRALLDAPVEGRSGL